MSNFSNNSVAIIFTIHFSTDDPLPAQLAIYDNDKNISAILSN